MEEKFLKLIEWFNGKKSIIGLIALNILQIDGLFDENNAWYKLGIYLAGILAAGGLTHKVFKKKIK